jgi:hypothetical protein
MKKARVSDNKKTTGRPPTGVGTLVGQRWHEDQLGEVDRWRRGESDMPGRAEAIRRLVEIGLAASRTSDRTRPGRSLDLGAMAKIEPAPAKAGRVARARELATETIGKMGDPTVSPDERNERRRRLTKGPLEFQEVRVDRAKK